MSDHDYLELGRRGTPDHGHHLPAQRGYSQSSARGLIAGLNQRDGADLVEASGKTKAISKHRKEGPLASSTHRPGRINRPKHPRWRQVLRTFFGDSPSRAIAALIDLEGDKLTPEEIARLDALLTEAREKGR